MMIRKYDAAADADGLRSCLSELQDYECTLDPRMPPGADVVEPLFREMMARCEAHDGFSDHIVTLQKPLDPAEATGRRQAR